MSFNQGNGSFATFIHSLTDKITDIFRNGLVNIENTIKNAVMKNNYLKRKLLNYVYQNELSPINTVINKRYIQLSDGLVVQSLLQKHPLEWSKNDFRKLKLIVHPDKDGNDEDFRTVNAFQGQISDNDRIYQNLLPQLLPIIQTVIRKTIIGFKVLDTAVDSGRLIYEPTLHNANKVVLDSSCLYSKYSGVNGFSAVISGSIALHQAYQGEYNQAFTTIATSISYMA